jgi:hypothetical protein
MRLVRGARGPYAALTHSYVIKEAMEELVEAQIRAIRNAPDEDDRNPRRERKQESAEEFSRKDALAPCVLLLFAAGTGYVFHGSIDDTERFRSLSQVPE